MTELCCAAPDLKLGWSLGLDQDNRMVLRVGDFVCRSCGTTYRLDGSTGCPLVALDADFSGAVLHIKRNDQATDGRRVM